MKILDRNDEELLIRVVHRCGHDQVYTKKRRLVERAEEKFGLGWLADNARILEENDCPGCFRFYGRGLAPDEHQKMAAGVVAAALGVGGGAG